MEQATTAETTIVREKVASPPKRNLEESAVPSPAKKARKGDSRDGAEAVPVEEDTPEQAESTTIENEAGTIGM